MECIFNGNDLTGIRHPKYLFRYMRDNDFLTEILREPYLWFSAPDALNDPFDCANVVDTENTVDELEWFARKSLARHELDIDFRAMAEKWHASPDMSRELVARFYELMMRKVSLCCCSGDSDNFLMWSHYADGHRGACIILDACRLVDTGQFSLVKVDYRPEMPRWNWVRERKEYGDSAKFNFRYDQTVLGTKTSPWEYECEYRLISANRGKNSVDPYAFVGLVLGARMSPSRSSELQELAAKLPVMGVISAELDATNGAVNACGIENPVVEHDVTRWQHLPNSWTRGELVSWAISEMEKNSP